MHIGNGMTGKTFFRRIVCVLLAFLTVGLFCFQPINFAEGNAAEKKVSIPNPADYFGDVDDTETGRTNVAYYFDDYGSFPQSKVDDYVKALKKAGVTTTDNTQNNTIINLKYNGKTCVQIAWDKSKKEIRVNVVQPLAVSDTVAVKEDRKTDAETTSNPKTVAVPNPADYFGEVDETTKGRTNIGFFCMGYSKYPESEMKAYIKALKKLGLTGGTIQNDDGDKVAVMKWNGKEEMWIRWDKGKKRMFINVSEPLTVAKPSDKTIISDKPSILDMIEDIFGEHVKVELYDDDTYSLYFFKEPSYPTKKMNQFAEELKDLGLKEVAKYSHSNGGKCIEYRWKDEECVKVWFYPHKNKDGDFEIGITWNIIKKSGKFDTADIPKETTPEPTGGGLSVLEDCGSCYGSGDCRQCGGRGEIKHRIIGQPGQYSTETCRSCSGLKKCSSCNGTGHK